MDILIGVIASVIASFVWWGLAQLYSFETRKKINYQLILLRLDNYDYEKYLEYQDYDLALRQAQRMLDEIGEIYSAIKPLTYLPKKRKLVNTLLNSLHTVVSRFQRYYKGYDGEAEKQHCCSEAKRHLFVVGYTPDDSNNRHPDPNRFQSVTSVSISLLSDLNLHKKKTLKQILSTAFCFNCSQVDISTRKKYYFDLIDVNAFRGSYSQTIATKFQISNDILTQAEYRKLIEQL